MTKNCGPWKAFSCAKVGLAGYGINEVYYVNNMLLFFDALEILVKNNPHLDYTALSDRLYRRYLDISELEKAETTAKLIQNQFSEISIEYFLKMFDWTDYEINELNFSDSNSLDQLFSVFFEKFYSSIKTINYFFQELGINNGLRLCVAHPLIADLEDESLTFDELNRWKGAPFWLRIYLKEYPNLRIPFDDGQRTEYIDKKMKELTNRHK